MNRKARLKSRTQVKITYGKEAFVAIGGSLDDDDEDVVVAVSYAM